MEAFRAKATSLALTPSCFQNQDWAACSASNYPHVFEGQLGCFRRNVISEVLSRGETGSRRPTGQSQTSFHTEQQALAGGKEQGRGASRASRVNATEIEAHATTPVSKRKSEEATVFHRE